MKHYSFCGLESHGLLLKGALPADRAISLAGGQFDFEYTTEDNTQVRCALLAVRIENLSTWKIPVLRWTYPEAVWMLALQNNSYLAIKAHTPAYMLPALALMDKYNTDLGAIALNKTGDTANLKIATKQQTFKLQLDSASTANDKLVENLWTRSSNAKFYRIPWGANTPKETFRMQYEITADDLSSSIFEGPVTWDDNALYFVDRQHDCAPAYSETPPLVR